MAGEACRDWRGALGAAALGAVDSDDDVALQAHLDGCADCRAELDELRAVAAALPLADLAHVERATGQPPAALGASVVGAVAGARASARRRRARRAVAAAAAVAALAGGVVAVGGALVDDGDDAGVVVALGGEGAPARAELRTVDSGTVVRFESRGLRPGGWYWLWVTDETGRRLPAGTFRGTREGVEVTLTAALPLDETRRVWVTDEDDEVVLDGLLPDPGAES
jgi:hypothetical protein